MKKIAIVYHSGYGHTQKVASFVQQGILDSGDSDVLMIQIPSDGKITDADFDILLKSDVIIFGSPIYMGSVSGPFKVFMDTTSKIFATGQWKDKYAAGFVNSGSLSGDKQTGLFQLVTFACQHGMVWISAGVPKTGETGDDVNRVNGTIGLMTTSDNAPADVTPPKGDLQTALLFGQRIAEFVKKG